jgi:pimeloyl-ACP methyl ester carboxylesterase
MAIDTTTRKHPPRPTTSNLRRADRAACAVLLATALAVVCGCSTLLAVKGQQRRSATNGLISGTVTTEHEARGPLIVGLVTGEGDDAALVDYFVSEKPGPWAFVVEPGDYRVGAYEDIDNDGRYELEPACLGETVNPIHLQSGARIGDLQLKIREGVHFRTTSFSLAELQTRGQDEQNRISLMALSTAGEVTSLEDPRFSREQASRGMWQYYDFLLESRPGIFFLQEYDPDRIPVLYVHGVNGTPRDFEQLIAALDREHFQPWVLLYPSGSRLDTLGEWAAQLLTRVRLEHDIERMAVVAHSMGGLVTRRMLLSDWEHNGSRTVRTYVTISSPLGGMASAGAGVEKSPIVLPNWYGLAPGSDFLESLYWKDGAARGSRLRLPEHIRYHLLFGYRGGKLAGSGDGIVALSSQLRPEAQEEAVSMRGFDQDHSGILADKATAQRLGEILNEMR